MIKVIKRSELQGAEKFGSCASCGCRTDEKEIYKVEFEDAYNNRTSLSLCYDCMSEFGNITQDVYEKRR